MKVRFHQNLTDNMESFRHLIVVLVLTLIITITLSLFLPFHLSSFIFQALD